MGTRTEASPTRVMDSSERTSESIDGTVAAASGEKGVLSKEEFGQQSFGDKASLYDNHYPTSS